MLDFMQKIFHRHHETCRLFRQPFGFLDMCSKHCIGLRLLKEFMINLAQNLFVCFWQKNFLSLIGVEKGIPKFPHVPDFFVGKDSFVGGPGECPFTDFFRDCGFRSFPMISYNGSTFNLKCAAIKWSKQSHLSAHTLQRLNVLVHVHELSRISQHLPPE